ncbi:SET domain-containing protein [Clathrospora elynae]|uniref:SET domain-containing protein n=1 Tax=Clathrospora elynae TaxID=706981 RepID=A0A6A5S9S3_9PLEO|nr:SET domain-containing protein [Clathrospora elynae]
MPSMVVIPTNGHVRRRVLVDRVHSIVSNRVQNGDEQYLVRWSTDSPTNTPPLSWHSITELLRCLEHVQDYLDGREKFMQASSQIRKRKNPDSGLEVERRASPFDRRLQTGSRTPSASRSSSVSSAAPSTSSPIDIYNGVLDADEHHAIFCRNSTGADIARLDIRTVPTPDMSRTAHRASVDKALTYIRNEYVRKLARVPGKEGKALYLINSVDSSTPSLRFRYISEYVLDEKNGVYRASSETQQGCTKCSPHMGRNIGCEYTKKCDCLEYAAVDESRLDAAEKAKYDEARATGASTMGFSKKFPYFASSNKRGKTRCLVPFYLNSRRPIYECNDKCDCGPYCRNKNVQFGRQVEVEIFRTSGGRGWGLRCKEDLCQGQFIDTYRGEVITDAEATRREHASSKAKASYLYSLDKFAVSESIADEDIYVVDGEFMGGPSKFINHSCEPNCRQYTVSYNKHDLRVYDIAFFACRPIPKGEELTFDYLDKDEGTSMDEPGEGAIPCLCGAAKCRKWLWT